MFLSLFKVRLGLVRVKECTTGSELECPAGLEHPAGTRKLRNKQMM